MTTTNSGRIAPTWRAANALTIALFAAFCTMPSMGDGPIFDPGGLGGGGGGGGTVVPPGPWGACLVGCPREIETPEDEYFCGDACAALASVGYDCGALDLEGWLEEHAFLMCPEGAWPGCCTEDDELCLGEQVVCCAEAWCEYQAALCGCQNIDDFHPAIPGSTSCDLTDDGKVDCQDLNDLWSEVSINDDCGITADNLIYLACCFLDKVSDHCSTVWTPDEDGGAQPGETACEDIRECVEAKIGRPVTPDELDQLMNCYGADPDDCGCCKETSQGSGVYYYNCDDDLVCDRNGDGNVDCDDLKQLIDDSEQGCNNGEELDDDEILEIACVFVAECAPQVQEDCEAFLNVVIDCLEDELCRSLTKDEVEDLGECTPNCDPTDCCTPAGGWNCGNDFKCDRNCDDEVDCADVQAYIDESEANCNEGQPPYDRAEKLALVCEFLTECTDEDLCADLLECIEGTILEGEQPLDATELAQLAACSGCEELCDPNDGEEQPKPGEGDEDCDGKTKTAAGPGGTDVPYGDTTESATDLVVAAAGPGFSATREYTSDPDYVAGCTNGANWSHSSTRHVDDGGQGYAGTDLVLKGSALGAITVDVSGTGPWGLPGSTSRYVTQATASVGEDTVDTWRVVDPGRTSTDYFDTAGHADPQLAALDGMLLQSLDPYGNGQYYEYAFYGLSDPAPRLRRVYVNGTPEDFQTGTPPDALVQFAYVQGSGPSLGKIARIDVFRFNGIDAVLTQWVAYTYLDSQVHSLDVGTDGDLVQVVTAERVDPVPGGSSPVWRKRVTQYRYHRTDQQGSGGVTSRGNTWAGSDHQLKLVIRPEQFEYLAQRLAVMDPGPPAEVDSFAADALAMADDALIWAFDADADGEQDTDEKVPLVDFAALVNAEYETTTDDKRITEQYVLSDSGCGCTGSTTQGTQLKYEYRDRDSDESVAETVVISEHLYDEDIPGYGASAYRTMVYEMYRPAGSGGVPYIRSQAVGEGASPSGFWVTYYDHDSAARNLIAEYTPAAVASYTPGDDGTNDPSYTFDTNGLVHVYEYTTDNRVAKRQLSQGPPTMQAGSCTDCVLIDEIIYGDGTGNTRAHLPAEIRRYRDEGGSTAANDVEVARFTYAFHGGSGDDVAWSRTEVEAETEAENGPASIDWYSSYELYDTRGDNLWSVAADSSITERTFESTGAGRVLTVVRNAPNTSMPASHEGLSTSGFGRDQDGGSLETEYVRDLMGRVRETVTPGLVSTYTLRHMFTHADRPGVFYYCELVLPHVIDAPARAYNGPAVARWYTAAGQALASGKYEVGPDGYGFGAPTQSGYPLLVTDYTLEQEIAREIVRHDISGLVKQAAIWNAVRDDDGDGVYDDGPDGGVHVAISGYDAAGRLAYTVNSNGTATRFTYDVLDRVIAVETGVADTSDWTPDNDTMSVTARSYFDSAGQASQGIGNGNITLIEEYTDTNHRDTVMTYDWRDRRQSTVNPLPPHEWVEYDNLDRVVARGVFTAEPSAIDDPLNSGGDFRGQYVETGYSQRGLVYRQAIATNPRSASPTFLETHTWFDETGRPVGTWGPNGPARKTTYDGLGRPATVYVTDRRDDAAPGASGNFADVYDTSGHAADVDGDVVLEQTDYRYILDEGLLDLVTVRRRAHDATTSETGALDGTGISASKVITSYSGTWYDAADRPIRQAEYGTAQPLFQSGGTAPTIDQQSPPDADADDATVLVSETTYNSRGLVDTTTDPAEQVTKFFFDSMDRRIFVVENYDETMPVSFTWTQSPIGIPLPLRWTLDPLSLDSDRPDVNRVTSFVFDGVGNIIRQSAYLVDGGGGIFIQETAYVYGVTPYDSPVASTLHSNDLLRGVWYPDSDGGGAGHGGPPSAPLPVFYSYNHLGELIASTDENNTEHTYTLDDRGRVTLDVAEIDDTITAFQIDDTVNAIEREFDDLGRLLRVKSYEDYGGGSQAVANAVEFDFNDLWQVTEVTQQPDGPIDGNSVSVTHTYDVEPISAGGNYSRLTDLGYPDGWTLDYGYGVSDSTNDRISRLLNLRDDSVNGYVFAQYDYVGMAIPAIVDYGRPDVQLTRFASDAGERTTGVYPGLDRYGRIIRQTWIDGDFDEHSTSSSVPNIPPIVDLAYTYDNASNRIGAFDARPGAQQPLSHLYAYDGLHRLQEAKRGVWDHDLQTPAVTHALGSQDWSLDPLGNWTATIIETNGTSGFQSDEEETRDHNDATSGDNEVNQLFERTLSSDQGGDELDITYDFAGSLLAQELTDDGQGTTTSIVHSHDAWNRLVKVQFKDGSGTLHPRAEYEYNGLNWRTVKRSDTNLTDGTHALDEQRLMYYGAGWQLLEERIDADYQSSPGIHSHMDYIWGARYIDDIVAHRRDSDPASQDGYEDTWFHLTDAQFSTVAIIDDNANVQKRVTYTAYGRARHHWYKDVDGDGDHDTTDRGIVQSLRGKSIDDAGYRAEADLDRDGDIDNADYTIAASSNGIGGQFGSPALPEGMLSSSAVGNQIGFDGYVFNAEEETYHVRWRVYLALLGRWGQADGLGRTSVDVVRYGRPAPSVAYQDGMSRYQYVVSRPTTLADPTGLLKAVTYGPYGPIWKNGKCILYTITEYEVTWWEYVRPWWTWDKKDPVRREFPVNVLGFCECNTIGLQKAMNEDAIRVAIEHMLASIDVVNTGFNELWQNASVTADGFYAGAGAIIVGGTIRFGRLAFSLDDLAAQCTAPCKTRLTSAGHSYQKHMSRGENCCPRISGTRACDYNRAGQELVEEILTHPRSRYRELPDGRGFVISTPDGRGIRFYPDGTMHCFGDFETF